MKNKIFDVVNVDDLPIKIKQHISRKPTPGSLSDKILELFTLEDHLTINEVIVGLYRKFNVVMTRRQMSAMLDYLSRETKTINPRLIKYSRGVYELAQYGTIKYKGDE